MQMFAKNSFCYKKLVNISPDIIEFQNWVEKNSFYYKKLVNISPDIIEFQNWVEKNSREVLGIISAMVMSNLTLDLKIN